MRTLNKNKFIQSRNKTGKLSFQTNSHSVQTSHLHNVRHQAYYPHCPSHNQKDHHHFQADYDVSLDWRPLSQDPYYHDHNDSPDHETVRLGLSPNCPKNCGSTSTAPQDQRRR